MEIELKSNGAKHNGKPLKALLLESVAQTAVLNFLSAGYVVETHHRLTQEELKRKIRDVHVIGIRSKTMLTKEVLDCAENLLVIGHFCIGTDQTDLLYAAKLGIPVFNSPFANTRSVAELMIAEIIMLARQAGDRSKEMHSKTWNKVSRGCHEVRGKTLGIVGYGHVGRQLSVLAESLGLKVKYYDIVPQLNLGNAEPVDTLEELLRSSDFVSLHVPKTPETVDMIGEKEVKMMKRGSYLLNASRGSVVVLKPVAEALRNGHLAGAAFDVYPSEPGAKTNDYQNELTGCPNTILTPHIGGSTEEAQVQIGIETSQKLLDYLQSGVTLGSVNFPEVSLPKLPRGSKRMIHVHPDIPGVLLGFNRLFEKVNIAAQALGTHNGIGFLLVDAKKMSDDLLKEVEELESTIKCRLLIN